MTTTNEMLGINDINKENSDSRIHFEPVKQKERLLLLDALRGLALFGILMVNLPLMYQPVLVMMMGLSPDAELSHRLADGAIKFFFEGKFYVLFSFLFGYGFWLFLGKEHDGQRGVVKLYQRRLLILLLFGILHILFLWAGDILFFYAALGLLLVLFRGASNRKIFGWSIGFTIVPSVLVLLSVALLALAKMDPTTAAEINQEFQANAQQLEELYNTAAEIYSNGSLPDLIKIRIKEWSNLISGVLFFYPVVLGMFLLGFLSAKKRLLQDYSEKLPFFRRLLWWGLGLGLFLNLIYVVSSQKAVMFIPDIWTALATITHTFGGIAFGMTYLSAITLLFAAGKSSFFRNNFAPVGRMALSNYIMHSIVGALIFHSYGLALFGKIETWQGMLITVAIFAVQIPLSKWWLSRFQFGPLEWLWRVFTYGEIQPMRIGKRT
jgi:uncharacterized protein